MKDKPMPTTAINPAVTVNPDTRETTFFYSIPPKTKATLKVLNEDETAFVSVPFDNNTGHAIGLPVVLPFGTSVSKIPMVILG